MLRAATSLLLVCLAATQSGASIDPHYERLLQHGMRAYRAGQNVAAIEELRIACFGMLEEPAALTGCLIWLGAAQGRAGDTHGLRATWERLREVEERFGTLETAAAEHPVQSDFVEQLRRTIDAAELDALAALGSPGATPAADPLDSLTPRKRRRELQRRIAAEPEQALWPRLLAQAELDAGRLPQARDHLDAALVLHPDDGALHCLAGRAAAGLGDDEAAVEHLRSCPDVSIDGTLALDYLQSLGRLERWPEAREVLASLDETVQSALTATELGRALTAPAGSEGRSDADDPASEGPSSGTTATETTGTEDTATEGRTTGEPETKDAATEAATTGDAVGRLTPGDGSATEESAPSTSPTVDLGEVDREAAPSTPDLEAQSASIEAEVDPDLSAEYTALAAGAERATTLAELDRVLVDALALADLYPASPEAQHLAAEIAYRAADWPRVIEYFERGGEIQGNRPLRVFYKTVALYETGRLEDAESELRRCLPRLQRTSYVDGYVEKILSSGER